MAARRSQGEWHSKWRHGRLAVGLTERRLARAVSANADVPAVLQIHDLAVLDRPYFVLQDLSYDLLLAHFGRKGVPHFRTLRSGRISRLRDRQVALYQASAGLLPMSKWLAGNIVASGVPENRIHVVNPGVNIPVNIDAPIPERRQGSTKRLLFLGRDFETKAGDQVVAAFRILRREYGPGIALTIAGPRRWPLPDPPPDGVDFVGHLPLGDVQELYDSHDLFVMPSRFEGFGIAFVEALVRGLPCIGRNACAMPEIIEPGSGGLLVQQEDPAELARAICSALGDDSLYEECAKAAVWRREHYTWDRAAAEILAVVNAAAS
jgi:glycosyltransferase involved in cell wall biosynthesis